MNTGLAALTVLFCLFLQDQPDQKDGVRQESEEQTVVEYKSIRADEVAEHLNQSVVMTYDVASAFYMKHRRICFLNSKADYRDEGNFVVVIKNPGIEAYMAKDIMDTSAHFRDKRIRVRGTITEYKGKPQLIVLDDSQIQILPTSDEVSNADLPNESGTLESEPEPRQAEVGPAEID